MIASRSHRLALVLCSLVMISSLQRCQAAAPHGAVRHKDSMIARGPSRVLQKQLGPNLSSKACSHKQETAQAVLDHVARGPQAQRKLSSKLSEPRLRPRGVQQLLQSTTDSGGQPANVSSNNSISEFQLQHYIHHLPTPAAPNAWWQLCQAIHSKGLAGLQSGLDPQQKQLPDLQGAAAAHCQLGRNPWAYSFANTDCSAYTATLFYNIAAGREALVQQLRAPAPQLDRFDLFHGHIFTAWNCSSNHAVQGTNSTQRRQLRVQVNQSDTAAQYQQSCSSQVGILFHAAEYPAYDDAVFPINLGHCQVNSSCKYNQRSMDLRNILWWQGQLAVLDVGVHSPLHDLLLHEGTEPLRTLYEEDFGKPVADLLLLQQQHRRRRRLAAEQQRLHRVYARVAAKGSRQLSARLAGQGQVQDLSHAVYVSY